MRTPERRPPRRGLRWTEADVRAVVQADPAATSITALARQLSRTPYGIKNIRSRALRLLHGSPPGQGDDMVDSALRTLGYYHLPRNERLSLVQALPWA